MYVLNFSGGDYVGGTIRTCAVNIGDLRSLALTLAHPILTSIASNSPTATAFFEGTCNVPDKIRRFRRSDARAHAVGDHGIQQT